MKQEFFTVESTRFLAKNTFETVLAGNTDGIRPGQFVNIMLSGKYLRRPISVCNSEAGKLTIVYKTVGDGTKALSEVKIGEKLDLLTQLGNGYDLSTSGDTPLLIGGGVGIPPLYMLCKELLKKGVTPSVILGFNSADEVFYEEEFSALGVHVYIATADGSRGTKGFVTDVMKNLNYSYFYTCGPMPMFRAINAVATTEGQLSFEERMGCGFGACMGCSCKTLTGNKRICREGPVMKRSEIIWQTQE